jgi:hypothetical protein
MKLVDAAPAEEGSTGEATARPSSRPGRNESWQAIRTEAFEPPDLDLANRALKSMDLLTLTSRQVSIRSRSPVVSS